jgi:hypothetical protein
MARCDECIYYDSRKCKRYPPVPVKREGYVEMMWPEVHYIDWCGEFKEDRSLRR